MLPRILTALILFAAVSMPAPAQSLVVVGITPLEDETGTSSGEYVARLFPVIFHYRVTAAPYGITLLNPGAMPDPTDLEWPAEVARSQGADVVLVGRVRALRSSSGDTAAVPLASTVLLGVDSVQLVLDLMLIEAASARPLKKFQMVESVRGVWFKDVFALQGSYRFDPPKFDKSPIGKAVSRAAEKLGKEVAAAVSSVAPASRPAIPRGANCEVSFRVWFKERKRASNVYSIAINGREETFGVRDGRLALNLPSGPALVHITVSDAPFRQLVQPAYYGNPIIDCGKPTVTLEIGNSGEGLFNTR